MHDLGFIHNDLKLENILIGDQYGGSLDQIKLIDFGFVQSIYDLEGHHISDVERKSFEGNPAFCSYNAVQGKTLSRRDDLISLVYILLYLCFGSLIFLGHQHGDINYEELILAKI